MKKIPYRYLKTMHVSELFAAAKDGSDEALTELIDRQQDGKALRYYPDGRKGPEDDGVVPVQIESKDGLLCIRSGRPRSPVIINRETVEAWIKGIPECLTHAANEQRLSGVKPDEVFNVMTSESLKCFSANIVNNTEDEETLTCTFLPLGESTWIVPPLAAAKIVRILLEICEERQWTFSLGKKETDAILRLLKIERASDS